MSIESVSNLEQVLAKIISANDAQELLQALCAVACAATGSTSGDIGAAILLHNASGVRALAAYGKQIPINESVDENGKKQIRSTVPQMPPAWLLALASNFPRILAQTVVDTPLAIGQNRMHSIFVPLYSGESHKVSLAIALPEEAFSKNVLTTMRVLRTFAQQLDKQLNARSTGTEPINKTGNIKPEEQNPEYESRATSHVQNDTKTGLSAAIHIASEVQRCQRAFEASVTFCAMTNAHLHLSRVALGEVHGTEVQVFAIDQMEKFLRGTRTVRLMEEAMNECLAQDCAINYDLVGQGHMPFADEHADIDPETKSLIDEQEDYQEEHQAKSEEHLEKLAHQYNKARGVIITAAAASFLRNAGGASILCLPLKNHGETRFVALFIAERTLTEHDQMTLRLACELTVPHLENLARLEEPLWRRLRRYTNCKLDDWFGPSHTVLKITSLCLAAFFTCSLAVQDTLELSAPLVVEGVHSYTQTSPVDSYLVEVLARPGDAVKKGDLLGRVDDTDIRLEKNAIETQRKIHLGQAYQYSQEGKEAEASLARLEAQKDTVNLQWAEARLRMTSLYAAVDGFVVSEDMYSRLGQPVRRGQELFEVADTRALRVVMHVPEDDVAHIRSVENPVGYFALTAYPDKKIAFAVERIHPFAHVEEGINSFEVRGTMCAIPDDILLRPGMEGLAQIHAGEHCLLYIWTRKIVEKITLWYWSL